MAVTTFHDIREDQYAAIVAITPSSLADVKFKRFNEDGEDLREWAASQPQAGLRLVQINHLDEQIDGPVLDAARVLVTAEILVAYPTDGRYLVSGSVAGKRTMREKVMREDHKSIEAAAGLLGYSSIGPDATVISASPFRTERIEKTEILVYEYTVAFSKDV